MKKVIATLFVLGLLVSPVIAAEPQTAKPITQATYQRPAQNSNERLWIEIINHKLYKKCVSSRDHNAGWFQREFNRQLKTLITSQGIDAFVEDALSWTSKGKLASNSYTHKLWLRSKFREHVFPQQEVRKLLLLQFADAHEDFCKFDNALLTGLKIDSPYDPKQLPWKPKDVAFIDDAFDKATDAVADEVCDAVIRSLGTLTASVAGGWVGQDVVLDLMRDPQGNATLMDNILSGLFGLGAAYVTETIAEEVLQPEQVLTKEVTKLTIHLLNNITSDGHAHRAIKSFLTDLERKHRDATDQALCQGIRVDWNWAAAKR
ncbi:MAG: hypothetical protein AAGD11_06315 [Planctomycetota bacterium]